MHRVTGHGIDHGDVIVRERDIDNGWTILFATCVVLVPIVGTIAAVWLELTGDGTSIWSYIAGALYFSSPAVAAAASERTTSPRVVRWQVAVVIFAVLLIDWLTQVHEPTQPGVWMGGTSWRTGTAVATFGMAAWLLAASCTSFFWQRRLHVVGFVAGAVVTATGSFAALLYGMMVP
jgi:hypothetical protein